jgi:hypothetical protein
VQGTTDHA